MAGGTIIIQTFKMIFMAEGNISGIFSLDKQSLSEVSRDK